jgi:hypothetical protein
VALEIKKKNCNTINSQETKMDCIFCFSENRANKIMFWNLCMKLIKENEQLSEI